MISDKRTHCIYNTSLENQKNKYQHVQCDRGVGAQAHTHIIPLFLRKKANTYKCFISLEYYASSQLAFHQNMHHITSD